MPVLKLGYFFDIIKADVVLYVYFMLILFITWLLVHQQSQLIKTVTNMSC